MPNPKTGESRLVPDLRPENIEEITETYTPEGGEEQTATYKMFKVPAIIRGILDEFAFMRTHARAVWYNRLANRTVADEIEELKGKMELKYTELNLGDITLDSKGNKTITNIPNRKYLFATVAYYGTASTKDGFAIHGTGRSFWVSGTAGATISSLILYLWYQD